MKAAIRNKYGSPEVLTVKEVASPEVKDNELLIKMHAATVNRTDCGILKARPFLIRFATGLLRPKFPGTGTDFAGVVEDIGAKVKNFKKGDRVWGFNDMRPGTHAEYCTIAEDSPVLIIPENISYEEAAASPEGAHYAYNVLNKVQLNKGDHVLVNGATGAIGSAAVQLLKLYSVNITAVCDTKNIELVKSLGAHKVIDYLKEDFTKGSEKYNLIIDAVGKSGFGKCKHLLNEDGIYISSELGPGFENLYLPFITKITGGKRVIFPIPFNIKRSLLLIRDLLVSSEFKPVIDRIYSLDEITEAFTYVDSGQKTGNVLIRFN